MLVGRREEQRGIDALLAGARLGHSGVLVVAGEAGIGKSALLEFAAAQAHGFHVLRAAGSVMERDLPFAGLAQLLRPLERGVADLPAPQARALGIALALEEGGEVDRFAVSAAVLGLVTRAAETRPVAVLVDDAHLLDGSSSAALAFLARRLLADPVVVLVAVRAGEGEWWQGAGLPGLTLGGLEPEQARSLVAAAAVRPLGREGVDRIVVAGGGNPLALTALARDPSVPDTPRELPLPVPAVVAGVFGRTLAALPGGTLRVLQVVAVAGGDLGLVARVCAAEGVALEGLDPAAGAGLVVTGPDRVALAHPLLGSALYATLADAERRLLHGRVADAVPEDDPDLRAWHRAAAALGPDEDVGRALAEVAVRAERRGAYAAAASAHERSARLSASRGSRARRLLAAGEAAWAAGELTRAAALAEEALPLDESGTVGAQCRTLSALVAARGGALESARDLLLASASGREVGWEDAVLRLAEAVNVCLHLLDTRGAVRAAEAIEALLPQEVAPDSARAAAVGRIAVGMARIVAGEPGAAPIRAGMALLAVPGSRSVPSPGVRTAWDVLGPLFLREQGTGRELVAQAVERRRAASALGDLPHLLFHLARDDATGKRWARAEAAYTEGAALAREFGQTTELAANLAGLTWLHARQGRGEDCRRTAAETLAVAEGRPLNLATVWVGLALAELDLAEGSVPAAARRLEEVDARLEALRALDPDLSPVPELVEALLREGERGRAAAAATAYLTRVARKDSPWSLARAARVRAMLAGDEQVDAAFGQALIWHARTPDAFEEARTRLAYGARLRRARRRVDAREQLRAAADAFDRLGAGTWAEAAAQELRATGLTVHRREAGPVEELTARELQIALLLADGRTTREAAAALFLSPKTVEYHLRHVYTKLGVASRAELTAAVGGR